MRAEARGEHVRRPSPRLRRATEQREQGQRGGHERGAERDARARLADQPAEQAVPDAEGGSIRPAQGVPELAILVRRDVRQVHDPGNDLSGHEAVVIVERTTMAPTDAPLDDVRKRQRSGAARARRQAPDRPGDRTSRPLLRAASVGGGAYALGKHRAESQEAEAEQDTQDAAATQDAPPDDVPTAGLWMVHAKPSSPMSLPGKDRLPRSARHAEVILIGRCAGAAFG